MVGAGLGIVFRDALGLKEGMADAAAGLISVGAAFFVLYLGFTIEDAAMRRGRD